jgi:hypothetical protein
MVVGSVANPVGVVIVVGSGAATVGGLMVVGSFANPVGVVIVVGSGAATVGG